MERQFFSGNTIEQAVLAAARHYGLEPDKVAYTLREKKHGFLNIRRRVVIEVDPSAPAVTGRAPAEEPAAGSPPARAQETSARRENAASAAGGDEDRPAVFRPADTGTDAPDAAALVDVFSEDAGEGDDFGSEADLGEDDLAGDVFDGADLGEDLDDDGDLEDDDLDEDDLDGDDLEDDDLDDGDLDGDQEDDDQEDDDLDDDLDDDDLEEDEEDDDLDDDLGRAAAGRHRRGGRGDRARGDGVWHHWKALSNEFAEECEDEDDQEIVAFEKALDELLELMDLDVEWEVEKQEEGFRIDLCGHDEDLLVEDDGRLLRSIEHLLPRLVRGLLGYGLPCRVDCNEFHEARDRELKDLAGGMAELARRQGKPQILEPMNPADRRTVHLALAEDPTVHTKSEGDGFMKRVRILPGDESG